MCSSVDSTNRLANRLSQFIRKPEVSVLNAERRQLVLRYWRQQRLANARLESFGRFQSGSGGDRRQTVHEHGEGSRLVCARQGEIEQLVDVKRRPMSLWTSEYERVVHGVR